MIKVNESMFTDYEKEAMLTATSAVSLRKKGGCLWCRTAENHHLRFKCSLIDDDGHTAEQTVVNNVALTLIADFCPKCGRFLSYQFKWADEAD